MDGSIQLGDTEPEIHEATIQHLYGLGLRLEACLHLIEEERETHIEIIDSAITSLGCLIDRLRARIEALE
jgi:hypothetical protein